MTARRVHPHADERRMAGARILCAQIHAARLINRLARERGPVVCVARDELESLARELEAVATVAEHYHLERRTEAA